MSVLSHEKAKVTLFGKAFIPVGTTVIGESAFAKNQQVRSVRVPGTVKRIERWAFDECENLTAVILDEGIQAIEAFAFPCGKLKEIVVPDSVCEVAGAAFGRCEGLEKPVYNRSGTVLYAYPRKARAKIFAVPAGVKQINTGAFEENPHLEEVILPAGLEVLKGCAFYNCGIRRLTIPEGVRRVESCAIWNCSSLEEVEILGKNTVLEERIVHMCNNKYRLRVHGEYPIDALFRATTGAFLQRKDVQVPTDFLESENFLTLARRCAEGEPDAMWAMGNYFAGLAEHPFYELAANFWRYRAYQKGSSAAKDWFQRWAKEHGKQGMSSLMSETMSGTFRGKVLRAIGFLFFDPDREYAIGRADANGVVEVSSWSSTEEPDEDGFGMEECYDWWYLSEDLREQPGSWCIHDFSLHDKRNNKERFDQLYNAVYSAIRQKQSHGKA